MFMSKRVAVIGLDGMPWHILIKLVKNGAMPNLKKIMSHSTKGILKSTIPPITPTAWTSMTTGVNPGKHGVFGFMKLTKGSDLSILNSYDVRYPRLHEMVALMGLKSLCVNLPLTYPIYKIRNIHVISDWMAPILSFYPEKLRKYAAIYPEYMLYHFWSGQEALQNLFEDSIKRVEAINIMIEELNWNVAWIVYTEPDNIFHGWYEDVFTNNMILGIFKKIDETIEKAVNLSDLVMIVSDHGFSKFDYLLSINTLLYKLGFASKTWKRKIKEVDHRPIKFKEKRVKIRIPSEIYKFLSLKQVKFVLKKVFSFLSGGKDIRAEIPSIDLEKSKAFYLSHTNGIWVKTHTLIKQIIESLRKTEGIKGVWRREEVFHGPYVSLAPHILISPDYDNGYQLHSSSIYPDVIMKSTVYDHHPDGIFIAYGQEVSPGWVGNINCEDIVPTILNYLNLPLPVDTDGKIIKGISSTPKKVRYYNYLNHWLLSRRLYKLKI